MGRIGLRMTTFLQSAEILNLVQLDVIEIYASVFTLKIALAWKSCSRVTYPSRYN